VQEDRRARKHYVHFHLLVEIGDDRCAEFHHSLIHPSRRIFEGVDFYFTQLPYMLGYFMVEELIRRKK